MARSGKGSEISVDGSPLEGPNQWQASERGDDLDTTNFESFDEDTGKSYETGIIGVQVLEFSFGGDWNQDANPHEDPPGIFVRDDLPDVAMKPYKLDDVEIIVPLTRVLQATLRTSVRGKVEFEAPQCKSNGPYTWL